MDNKYGLVLDGEIAVGHFVFSTPEDNAGQRQLMKLDLNSGYIDITNGRTKNIRCLLVEKIPNEQVNDPRLSTISNPLCVKIIEDFGIGTIEGKFLLSDRMAHYKNALFTKMPKKLNSKLN